MSAASKRVRVDDNQPKNCVQPCSRIIKQNPLRNDPYFSLICPFFTSVGIISKIAHLTKWNYYYFKGKEKNNDNENDDDKQNIKYMHINNGKNIINKMLTREFGHKNYFIDIYDNNSTTNILDTSDNYSKIKQLYNRIVSNDDILNIFGSNGYFALKYFILKLNDETRLSTLWNDILNQVEEMDILQSKHECNCIGDKARIIIAENYVMCDQTSPGGISGALQGFKNFFDKTNVDSIYYCRSKQTSFGTMENIIVNNNNNDNDNDHIYEKYHLYFFKKILMDSQLLSKFLSIHDENSPAYCHQYMDIIFKIGKIFYFLAAHAGTGQLPHPPESKNATILFKHAILYDQYVIDQFIFPLVKYRLDYEFNLFTKDNIKNNNDDNTKFIVEMEKNSHYQNILHIIQTCAIIQNNIVKTIETVDQFIENYKNSTFHGGSDHSWAMSSVEQQIIKLEQVKHNLKQLNFSNINNLFKDWFDKSSKLWNDIMNNDKIKNDMDEKIAVLKEVTGSILKKIIPNHWPYVFN